MNKLFYAAPLLLAACTTIPDNEAARSAAILAGALTYEKGVQLRCPRNMLEWTLHVNARLTFDLTLSMRMTEFDRSILARVRVEETDVKCPAVTPLTADES